MQSSSRCPAALTPTLEYTVKCIDPFSRNVSGHHISIDSRKERFLIEKAYFLKMPGESP
jgi:hypothetical protein